MSSGYKKAAAKEMASKKNSWKAIAGTRTAAMQVSNCKRLCVYVCLQYICVYVWLAVCDLKSNCVQDDFVKDCKAAYRAAQRNVPQRSRFVFFEKQSINKLEK